MMERILQKMGLRTPQSYSEAFDILGEGGVLEPEFAYAFAKIAGFRNFLAHDYDKIEAAIICGKVINSISEVKQFIRQISESCGID